MSARAAAVLAAADTVVCEDTRRTGRLLARLGIEARLVPYHDHSPARTREGILRGLAGGALVALVSDAGTPLVSDPGHRLVRAAIDAAVPVRTAPGPSSPLAALVVSGLPSDRFLFAGFLPPRRAARRGALGALADIAATLVLLESPRRLAAALGDMHAVLGDRRAAVARELTKLHEEVRRGRLGALAEAAAAGPPPRGEIVVVVEGRTGPAGAGADIDALLDDALATLSVRDAAAAVAAATGRPRSAVYARALARAGRAAGG